MQACGCSASWYGLDTEKLDAFTDDFDATTADIADGLSLGALGWATSSQSITTVYGEAARLAAAGDTTEADRLLVESWENTGPASTVARVETLSWWDDDLNALRRSRARVVAHCWDRHIAGDYLSSVPLTLTQIEGLTADYTNGKMFFSKRPDRQADVIDETSLTTVAEGLATVRDAFSVGLNHTTSAPTMSRHGVLHGRSTGYDTRTYSAKCLALFAAVLDMARMLDRALEPRSPA